VWAYESDGDGKNEKEKFVLDEWRETVAVGFGWEVNVEA